jgi:hypothetical protein
MTGNSAWLWTVPVIFAVAIAIWIATMLWGDRRRNTHGNDMQPKRNTGPAEVKRGPVQGGVIEGDPAQRRPGHEPGDPSKQEDYYPGP